MELNYTLIYLKLIEEIAQDGELSYKEIYQLAEWLKNNKEGRKSWPASVFFPLLKNVFADGKIERPEAEQVGRLIQKVRREWARENSLCGAKLDPSQLDNLITKFDSSKPVLPVIENQFKVAATGDPNAVFQVDFTEPSCCCDDFKTNRQHLPTGHISRCCEHIMLGYSQIRPDDGWPSWLDSLLEAGFRPLPNQKWTVVQLGGRNYLVSSADPNWGNIYAQVDGEDLKYSYHLTEKRWAYDSVPQDAEALIETVCKLSG